MASIWETDASGSLVALKHGAIVRPIARKRGKCQSESCEYPNEVCEVTYYRGRYLCTGCLEDAYDREDYDRANEADRREAW